MRRSSSSGSSTATTLLLAAAGTVGLLFCFLTNTAAAFRLLPAGPVSTPAGLLPPSQQQLKPWAAGATVLEARKGGRKGAGEGFGAPVPSSSSNSNNKKQEEEPVPGEGVTPAATATGELAADVKRKMEALGASIEALAAQVVRLGSWVWCDVGFGVGVVGGACGFWVWCDVGCFVGVKFVVGGPRKAIEKARNTRLVKHIF